MKKKVVFILSVLFVFALLITAGCDKAEEAAYPNQPVTIIAPAGPGSGWDMTARAISQVLADQKLVPVALPIENKAGGGGTVASTDIVQNKDGDAYTLVVYSPPLVLTNLNGQTENSFRNLTPLAQLFADYMFFGVNTNSKYQSLTEIMAALKENPKSVKIGGASAPGSMDHLAFMDAARAFGVDVTQIPYISFQSGGELNAALLGNSVDVISTSIGDILGQLEAGNVRGLAITSEERMTDERISDIPTLKELGIDSVFVVWRGIFGPPNMPAEAKAYWEDVIAKMVETDAWKETLAKYNWQPTYAPSAEFITFLEGQEELLGGLLKDLGLVQ